MKTGSMRSVQLLSVEVPSPVTWLPFWDVNLNPAMHSARKFHT